MNQDNQDLTVYAEILAKNGFCINKKWFNVVVNSLSDGIIDDYCILSLKLKSCFFFRSNMQVPCINKTKDTKIGSGKTRIAANSAID